MSDNDNVIDIKTRLSQKSESESKITPGTYEFHMYPVGDGENGEVSVSEGFLKFGPQFIAVVDGPKDESNVIFAIATNAVKYVKKLDAENAIQATLSL
jgi:hypothetical protein